MSNTSVISSQDPSSQLLLEALKINAEATRANAQNIAHLAVNAPNLPSSSSDPQGRDSQLVEALKINAEATRANAQNIAHLAVNAPSLPSSSSDPQGRDSQLVEALKSNIEATRVSAQALAHLVYHGPKRSGSAPDSQPSLSPQPISTAKPAEFVINERVGKITTAEWDALGSERIALLVKTLRGIADELALPYSTWEKIGDMIQSRLNAGSGFVFLARDEVNITSDWTLTVAKGEDKKSIAAEVLDCSRHNLGSGKWYTHEMVSVWKRLIEITDA